MKFTFFIFICLLFLSCKKDKTVQLFPIGIYVEETLRLDTMDFTVNNLVDYSTPSFNFKQELTLSLPIFPSPGFMNGPFQFVIKNNNTIDLRSMLSSNSNYANYYFDWQQNTIFFSIDKFFIRNNLPSRLRFVKL